MANKIYEMVTDQIIAQLEKGTVPWHKPWKTNHPRSLVGKRPYRGINTFLLGMQGFDSPFWATFNQISKQGGKVKSGEKGTIIVFWKWIEEKDEDGNETGEQIPILRYFRVWNTDQTTGLKVPDYGINPEDFNPILEAETIIANMENAPNIEHGGDQAFYRPPTDLVNMPKPERFDSPEHYYSVMFHELAHSTGHQTRLNRTEVVNATMFGSTDYSQEELVAEMTTAMVCATIGISQPLIANQAAYIQSWLSKLKDDKRLLVKAGGRAQKAADYILGDYGKDGSENDSDGE